MLNLYSKCCKDQKRNQADANLFRKQDAEKVAPHTAMFLSRAVQKGLVLGFTRSINFYLATPEKAILDTLYYRKGLPARDELEKESSRCLKK